MSHQHHQRMSLRVANSNVSASVVDNTNTTNTATNRENNEENTNQMTCVVRVFFFSHFAQKFGTPFFFGLSFCTEKFLSREFNNIRAAR